MRSKVAPKRKNIKEKHLIDTTATISSCEDSDTGTSTPESASPTNNYVDKYKLKECKIVLNRNDVDDYLLNNNNNNNNNNKKLSVETNGNNESLVESDNDNDALTTSLTPRNGFMRNQKLKIKLFPTGKLNKSRRKNSIESEFDASSSSSSSALSDESTTSSSASSSSSVFVKSTCNTATTSPSTDQSSSKTNKTSSKYDDLCKKYAISECEVVLSRIDLNTLHNKTKPIKKNGITKNQPNKSKIELKECKVLVEKLDNKTIEKYNKTKANEHHRVGKYNTRATRQSGVKYPNNSTSYLDSDFDDDDIESCSIITMDD